MTGSLYDLLRDLYAHGTEFRYQTSHGTCDGVPVIYQQRWFTIPHDDGELPHIVGNYGNWPPDGTYEVHAYFGVHRNDQDRLLMPVESLAEVWQLWDDIKACLDRPEFVPEEPMGQLDIFDVIAASP